LNDRHDSRVHLIALLARAAFVVARVIIKPQALEVCLIPTSEAPAPASMPWLPDIHASQGGWTDEIRLGRSGSFAEIANCEALGERHIRLLALLATEASWFQETPAPSLELMVLIGAPGQSSVIDIGAVLHASSTASLRGARSFEPETTGRAIPCKTLQIPCSTRINSLLVPKSFCLVVRV
jgi:hypothetical protein